MTGSVAPVELALPSAGDAPATARAAIAAGMADHVSEAVLADALLVVGELVANSVRHAEVHADADITVRADLRPEVLHLEVADRGNGGSVARRAPDLEHGGGFGLNLVDTLSRRWGVDRAGGTRVWAELARAQRARGRATSDGATARDHGSPECVRPQQVKARARAAWRRAAAVCDAAARAQENARRACDRGARLRAQRASAAGTTSDASALDKAAWAPAALPIPAAPA